MKACRVFRTLLVFSIVVVSAAAAPIDDIRTAIQNLEVSSNYSWESLTKSKNAKSVSRQSPIVGRTERGGFTFFQFVLDGNSVEVVFKGKRAAIKTETKWESDLELQGDRAWIARRLQGFKPPVVEAVDLIAKAASLKKSWLGVYSGKLTSSAVGEFLSNRSRDQSIVTVAPGASGTFKLWEKKGRLAKYEFRLKGRVILKDYGQEFNIDRTTTVEIEKVGSTQVAVPAQAKAKLVE